MQFNPARLRSHLQRADLLPVYLLHGEEPQQKMELQDALRQRAAEQGYSEREVLAVERGFDWSALAQAAGSLSLFADRRVIELRLGSSKPGRDGSAALQAYTRQPPPDTLLLISAERLDYEAQRSAWFKAIAAVGATVACQALSEAELQAWIRTRLNAHGLEPTATAVELICERVEGNLLAAAQEVDKLNLLCEPGPLEAARVLSAVADSARFNPFDLSQAALAGDPARCARILAGLREEGVALTLVHWVLRNDVRLLLAVAQRRARGESLGQAFSAARIGGPRQSSYKQALARLRAPLLATLLGQLARADRIIKGMDAGLGTSQDTQWQLLLELTLRLAGAQLPRRLSF